MTPDSPGRLVGRTADLARLRDFLGRVRDGGDALLLQGDPGVGKTALLHATEHLAVEAGLHVRRIAAGPLEADIDHALLHALLQALDLESAAHDIAVAGVDRRALTETIAAHIRAAGAGRPVLMVIDDLQWADPLSRTVLRELGRRPRGLGLLGAARGTGPPEMSWPAQEVGPLPDADAEVLAVTALELPVLTRRRVLAAARGNPQALREFAGVPLNEFPPDDRSPLLPPGRLRQAYAEQLGRLPAGTRWSLLLAALTGVAEGRMFARLGDLEPALRERLVVPDPEGSGLRFRHPLIRVAVESVSTAGERARAHATLADLLVDEPMRRVWHMAEASLEPDESVAALLECAAQMCLRDGQPGYALSALLRAADQSPTPHGRGRRLTEAAYVGAAFSGDLHIIGDLLEKARAAEPDAVRSLAAAAATAEVLLGRNGDVETAHRLLRDALTATDRRLVADEPELSDALFVLVETCRLAMREDLWESLDGVLARFGEIPPLLRLWVHVHRGPAFVSPADLRLLDELTGSVEQERDAARLYRITLLALVTDRGPLCRTALQPPSVDGDGGEAARLALTGLFAYAYDEFAAGRWDHAVLAADDIGRRGDERGDEFIQRIARMIPLTVDAARGGGEDTAEEARQIASWASPRGLGGLVSWCHHVQGVIALGRGDYEDAFQHATAVTRPGTIPSDPIALRAALDLVESAMRTGRAGDAVAHAEALRAAGAQRVSDRLALLTAGVSALVAPDDGLDEFRLALAMPAAARYPFEAARIRLIYGERLRRNRLTLDARGQLAAALTAFRSLGARPWAERAARELEAASVARHRGGRHDALHLTPQESEVADLAATGLRNRQIADRLQLSPLTVAAHLRTVYRKLGITSRSALRAALTPDDESEFAS